MRRSGRKPLDLAPRKLLLLLLATGLLAVAGCKVEATVSVAVREDGSGTVAVRVDLDAEAVREAEVGGGRLEDRVRLSDLEAAGWRVTPWRRHDDGGATLRIAKEFAEPGDLEGVFAELNGRDGPLRDVSLSRDAGALRTEYRFNGTADLSMLSTGIANDPELVASLTANQVDLTALDQRLLERVREAFRLEVEVSLPGRTRAFVPAPGEEIDLSASSSRWDPRRSAYLVAAGTLAVLALALFLTPTRRRRRRRRGSRS